MKRPFSVFSHFKFSPANIRVPVSHLEAYIVVIKYFSLSDVDFLSGMELLRIVPGNRFPRPVDKIMEVGFQRNFGTCIRVHRVRKITSDSRKVPITMSM